MSLQSGWRWCSKCRGLYYALSTMDPVPGFPWILPVSPGLCPVGGGHNADGSGQYAFFQSVPATTHQANWHWCFRCQGMFFANTPRSGVCPAGGQHDSSKSGNYFALTGSGSPDGQAGWRWCKKCAGLFHAGSQSVRGRCPGGGMHDSSQSTAYVVPWDIPDAKTFHSDIHTSGGAPVGGWIDIKLSNSGQFTFSGHMHNSGFPNYEFAVVAVIMTREGIAYSFRYKEHVEGTVEIFGRDRDEDWIETGNNTTIKDNWKKIAQGGTLYWDFVVQDTITKDLQQMLNDLAKKAFQEIAQAGVLALIALIPSGGGDDGEDGGEE